MLEARAVWREGEHDNLAAAHFDTSRAPLIVVTFEGSPSDADFDAYLGRMSRELRAHDIRLFILDARQSGNTSLSQLQKQAAWMKQEREHIQRSLGTVFVMDRPVVRFALSTVLALAPLPGKFVVVGTIEEAFVWATHRFGAAGISLPRMS